MNDSVYLARDPSYHTILVPLDGSHRAEGALRTARALAARFDATIHTVTVADSDFDHERIRADAAHALGTDPDDTRIHVEVEVDADVADAVHRRAAELDQCLVCLSTHGRGRVAGTLIGSTARHIVERGREPVVVAGPLLAVPDPEDHTATPPLEVGHLVACVDGREASERVLPVAAAWARALGMKLTIATVAEPIPPPVRPGAPWGRHHGPDEDADAYLGRLGDRWALESPGLDTFVVYDPISVGAGMKDYISAHPTGLIAVASHLRSGIEHFLFGSGAADIVHSSTAPVLVVPVM